jgi:hypothetical protein
MEAPGIHKCRRGKHPATGRPWLAPSSPPPAPPAQRGAHLRAVVRRLHDRRVRRDGDAQELEVVKEEVKHGGEVLELGGRGGPPVRGPREREAFVPAAAARAAPAAALELARDAAGVVGAAVRAQERREAAALPVHRARGRARVARGRAVARARVHRARPRHERARRGRRDRVLPPVGAGARGAASAGTGAGERRRASHLTAPKGAARARGAQGLPYTPRRPPTRRRPWHLPTPSSHPPNVVALCVVAVARGQGPPKTPSPNPKPGNPQAAPHLPTHPASSPSASS